MQNQTRRGFLGSLSAMALIPFVPMPLIVKPKIDLSSLDGVYAELVSVSGSEHSFMTIYCTKKDITNPALQELIDMLTAGREVDYTIMTWSDNDDQKVTMLSALRNPHGITIDV